MSATYCPAPSKFSNCIETLFAGEIIATVIGGLMVLCTIAPFVS